MANKTKPSHSIVITEEDKAMQKKLNKARDLLSSIFGSEAFDAACDKANQLADHFETLTKKEEQFVMDMDLENLRDLVKDHCR